MDRVFILQKEYVENRHNPDGLIYKHILEQFKNINLDEVYVCDSDVFTVDNTIIRNAKKMKKKIIPVGSLEFVQSGLNNIAERPVYMKPIEIPNVPKMLEYAKREYKFVKGADITDKQLQKNLFIKDATNLKKWNNLLNDYTDRNNALMINE